MGIKFNKDTLAVEQNNYLTKIVNTYIFYDLASWPRIPTNNFKFNNSLSVATNIPKNSNKEKFVLYSKYGITFDSPCSRGFGDNSPRNVDDNSSPHVDNLKKKN